MDFTKTITNKGVVCILFKEQKYRFIREMANGNVSLRFEVYQKKNVLLDRDG